MGQFWGDVGFGVGARWGNCGLPKSIEHPSSALTAARRFQKRLLSRKGPHHVLGEKLRSRHSQLHMKRAL